MDIYGVQGFSERRSDILVVSHIMVIDKFYALFVYYPDFKEKNDFAERFTIKYAADFRIFVFCEEYYEVCGFAFEKQLLLLTKVCMCGTIALK